MQHELPTRGLDQSPVPLLTRPFNNEQLVAMVRSVLDGPPHERGRQGMSGSLEGQRETGCDAANVEKWRCGAAVRHTGGSILKLPFLFRVLVLFPGNLKLIVKLG